jgi:hypothetical protein
MESITNIPINVETRELLKKRGSKGDTYDAIIRELLDKVKEV